jgi:hypothetical protein
MNDLLPCEISQSDFAESEVANFVSPNASSGNRIYGHIPQLPGSQMTSGDRKAKDWQIGICCEKLRDAKDYVVVQEKLDGSCMAVAKQNSEIIPLARSGNRAAVSRYKQHRFFHKWVYENLERFDELLADGETCIGEWLMQAHGTRYDLPHEPFVIFDLRSGEKFLTSRAVKKRVSRFNFIAPRTIHEETPITVEEIVKLLQPSGHGAIDLVEGAVWRVERNDQVDFLAKYVRPDKRIGCFLPERPGQKPIWNWQPSDKF